MAKNEDIIKTPQARFDFNQAVDDALRRYPHLADNTVFVEAPSNLWRGADIGDNEKSSLESVLEKARREDISFTTISGTFNLQAMIYAPRQNRAVLFEDANTDRHAIFDHELAHLAIDGANTKTKLHPIDENICDAYAMLRHLQRSNGDESGSDFCGWKRAFDALDMKTVTHLTSFAIDRILADAGHGAFQHLTPAETSELSVRYAEQYAPDPDKSRQIIAAFAPLWGELRTITPDNLSPIHELAKITLRQPVTSPAFYVGHRVLAGFLKDEGITVNGQRIILQGDQWDDIRHDLREKYKGLDKSSPLIKFGLKIS